MNILLVDDDEILIQVLKERLDWKALEIDAIYTANNIRQAKVLLENYPIQIMVCDIEMPQGNGLDLLEWVRSRRMELQTIFLTSYAEFEYARRAIALDSLNYYLKPIDHEKLEQGIVEAVRRVKKGQEQERFREESGYWKKNQETVIQNFLRELLSEESWQTEEELLVSIQNAGLSYRPDTRFLPFLLELYEEEESPVRMKEDTRTVPALLQIAQREAEGLLVSGIRAVCIKRLSYVVLLELSEEEIPFLDVRKFAEKFARACRETFHLNVFLGIGNVSTLFLLKKEVSLLERIRADHVKKENRIVSVMEYENRELTYHLPAITAWETLLLENRVEEFLDCVQSYLKERNDKVQLNQEILRLFRMDLVQLMYARLKHTQIEAYKLLISDTGEKLYEKSADSVEDMMVYVRYLVKSVMSYVKLEKESDSVIAKIKNYLDLNYAKDISRSDLAEIVYLNPDYISRLFKKEMGISISAYLMKKRMDKAKELLLNTSMPVNVISMHAGYNNYSYFTRMFKEYTGYSPNEYRKRFK